MSTFSNALICFGLEQNLPVKELKAVYRRLAAKAHPDKGGSTEAMQQLNEAYEVLVRAASTQLIRQSSWAERKAQIAEDKLIVRDVLSTIMQGVDLEAIGERLSIITGKDVAQASVSNHVYDNYAHTSLLWRSSDKQSAVNLSVTLHINDIRKHHGALSSETSNYDFPLYVSLSFVHEGRDIKLSRSRYSSGKPSALLFDLEELLPIKKAKKSIEKALSRAPKRIDGINFLKLCAGFRQLDSETLDLKRDSFRLTARRTAYFKSYSGTLYNHHKYVQSISLFSEDEKYFSAEIRSLLCNYQDTDPTEWLTISNQIKQAIDNASSENLECA